MQGTRLPDAVLGEPGPGWDEWGGKADSPKQAPAGAYMKVTSRRQDGGEWVLWYIRDPEGRVGSIGRNHTVVEHDDGTITVAPSLDHKREEWSDDTEFAKIAGQGWHGWLRNGVWESW
jgi:hypothetical protein